MIMLFQPPAGCLIKADIVFLLDVSGSVTNHFNKVIEFEREFINNVTKIGPKHNQIGTVLFNKTATTLFNLNTYTSKSDIIHALSNLSHDDTGGKTNLVDGICHVIHSFDPKKGAREVSHVVMRFVIIITDGRSNDNGAKTCNLSEKVSDAAKKLHESIDPATVIVIGITDNINSEELISVASNGSFQRLDSFNRDLLIDAQQELLDLVCRTGITLLTCYSVCDCYIYICVTLCGRINSAATHFILYLLASPHFYKWKQVLQAILRPPVTQNT